jgi:predicted RNA-binding protein with PIN domain
MRLLIDGYNLMHCVNLPPGKPKLGPDGLRRLRDEFLRRLATALGPVEASLTTIVFDASDPLATQARQKAAQGLTVLYAADADERIEQLIDTHKAHRSLTVVSSDLRIRAAAKRKKATPVGSEAFWVSLEDRAAQARRAERARRKAGPIPMPPALSDAEVAAWEAEFRDVDAMPETKEIRDRQKPLLSDAEVAHIAREVEAEFGPSLTPARKRRK